MGVIESLSSKAIAMGEEERRSGVAADGQSSGELMKAARQAIKIALTANHVYGKPTIQAIYYNRLNQTEGSIPLFSDGTRSYIKVRIQKKISGGGVSTYVPIVTFNEGVHRKNVRATLIKLKDKHLNLDFYNIIQDVLTGAAKNNPWWAKPWCEEPPSTSKTKQTAPSHPESDCKEIRSISNSKNCTTVRVEPDYTSCPKKRGVLAEYSTLLGKTIQGFILLNEKDNGKTFHSITIRGATMSNRGIPYTYPVVNFRTCDKPLQRMARPISRIHLLNEQNDRLFQAAVKTWDVEKE